MKNINDIITRAGGLVTEESWPSAIPVLYFEEVIGTLNFLSDNYEMICNRYGSKAKVTIVLTQSPSFSCKVTKVDKDRYLILIPLGVPARICILARIVLPYIDNGQNILMVSSLRDNIQIRDECIPKLLHPIFLDNPDYENYWDALNELYNQITPNLTLEDDVIHILRISLIFLVSHELTHILNGHLDLLERSNLETVGLSKELLMRGIEIDADDEAAALSMLLLQLVYDPDFAHFRLGFATTMLFGISDVQQRRFANYEGGRYNHPVVRCDIFANAVAKCIDASPKKKKHILDILNKGWEKCVFAFNCLHMDAWQGRFGNFSKKCDSHPFHLLLYGRSESLIIDQMASDAEKLLRQVRSILPFFQNRHR